MYAFTYWHAYYDSAYLHYPLKISPFFYQEYAPPHLDSRLPPHRTSAGLSPHPCPSWPSSTNYWRSS